MLFKRLCEHMLLEHVPACEMGSFHQYSIRFREFIENQN